MTNDKKHYRFALISDIHIDRENKGENTYFIYAEENLSRALGIIKDLGCDFIISTGDQVTNASGAEEEWRVYRDIIKRSGCKDRIYAALGNHETRSAKYGINTLGECISDFIKYAKLNKKDIIRPDGKPYYMMIEPVFGDIFIFMANEKGADINEFDNFSDEQMDWVEDKLRKYTTEGRGIFLIQHANYYKYGAGDDITEPAYEGAVRTIDKSGNTLKNNLRFKHLTEKYRDMIWVSGHTHIDLADNVNYSDNGGKSCHMLHIPALAGTTRLSRDSMGKRTLDRTFHKGSSQGYIVDVYEDKTVFSGIDLYSGEFYPQYTYTIYRKRDK